jgi:hypothetical protein
MAQDVPITDLPVGSTFKLKARIVSDDGTTMNVEFLQNDGTVHGDADITKATGAMTGQLTVALEDTAVEAVAIAVAINDVLQNQTTGEVVVVQATGLGPNQDLFSTSTAGQPTYQAEGWTKVGTATIT